MQEKFRHFERYLCTRHDGVHDGLHVRLEEHGVVSSGEGEVARHVAGDLAVALV